LLILQCIATGNTQTTDDLPADANGIAAALLMEDWV
jgi:hypothetical protein